MIKNDFRAALITWVQHWIKFFREDLWRFDFTELTRIRKSFYRGLQVLVLVGQGFIKDRLLLRASALTYSTLLAIVPLLAFMFAVLKGMGIQRRLEPLILERIAIGSKDIVNQVLAYIDRVNVGSLGAIGLLMLLLTIISVLGNIESSFNDIWGIRLQRSLLRKFSDYLSLLIIMPIVLFAALSLTASLKSTTVVSWFIHQPGLGPLVILFLRCLPYLALWAVFTFLFMFMPNTKVRLIPGLTAGIFAGTLWQLTQWTYVTFQVGVTKYNAIYGTFAQLPIMMIWIYISWVVVLFGAELSFALQNVGTYRREQESQEVNFLARVELALLFLQQVQSVFQSGGKPWTAEALAQSNRVPVRLAHRVLDELIQTGFLTKSAQDEGIVFVPNRQLLALPMSEVWERLEQNGPGVSMAGPTKRKTPRNRIEHRILRKAILARRKGLQGESIGQG